MCCKLKARLINVQNMDIWFIIYCVTKDYLDISDRSIFLVYKTLSMYSLILMDVIKRKGYSRFVVTS